MICCCATAARMGMQASSSAPKRCRMSRAYSRIATSVLLQSVPTFGDYSHESLCDRRSIVDAQCISRGSMVAPADFRYSTDAGWQAEPVRSRTAHDRRQARSLGSVEQDLAEVF